MSPTKSESALMGEIAAEQLWATSALEWGGAITGFICVWLTVREHVWCWPIGILSAILYGIVFSQQRLYADMGLQIVFVVLQIYGWYAWMRGGPDREPLVVNRVGARQRLVLTGVFAVGTFVLADTLYRHTDASLPWVDSTQTVLSLIAQYLLSFKMLESWMLWIAVDVISIGMYHNKGLYVTEVLYLLFLGMAVQGLLRWRRVWRDARRDR